LFVGRFGDWYVIVRASDPRGIDVSLPRNPRSVEHLSAHDARHRGAGLTILPDALNYERAVLAFGPVAKSSLGDAGPPRILHEERNHPAFRAAAT